MFEYFLVITSFGFMMPLLIPIILPIWLQYSLFFTGFISAAFWTDPILHRHTILHQVDGILARIMIMTVIMYAILKPSETLGIFSFMTIMMMAMFYASANISEKEWCSPNHIGCHIGSHLFAIGAICYV
jgi:hypothetical protein